MLQQLTVQLRAAQPPALPEAASGGSADGGKTSAGGKVEKEDTRLGKWQALQRALKLMSLLADSKVD